MNSPRIQKVLNEGPVGRLHVWKTPLSRADKMLDALIVQLVVGAFIAYLTRADIPGPAPFGAVFRVAATAGVLAHCFALIPSGLWWGSYKRLPAANILDGLISAAITGALSAWLWPG